MHTGATPVIPAVAVWPRSPRCCSRGVWQSVEAREGETLAQLVQCGRGSSQEPARLHCWSTLLPPLIQPLVSPFRGLGSRRRKGLWLWPFRPSWPPPDPFSHHQRFPPGASGQWLSCCAVLCLLVSLSPCTSTPLSRSSWGRCKGERGWV